MPDYFPAFLDLRGRRCLVVGGGEIGERKTHALLDCGARVTIVSPSVTTRLAALAASGRLVHRARPFRRSDPRGCALAVAATGDPRVDRVVAAAARRWRALVNVVDRPQHCDFIVPAVLRRGELQIAVSTGGRSPAIAREIRRRLERFFGPEYGELISRAGEARNRARARARTSVERIEAGERVARLVLAGRLPV
jgi:precorrin-2 dehydrogenase / sirohydrochlorin ferrochelatase